jgi:hypothetical protein
MQTRMDEIRPLMRSATKSIKTNNATSMRARHGVLLVEPGHDHGIQLAVAKPSHGPAPLWSQDLGRRLLPG